MEYKPIEVKVWGKYACFTRPETKLERVSYEVPTPSAARGILEAIYWEPPMRWRVREIQVLNPVRHFSILRNEVTDRGSTQADYLDPTANRSQKHTLCLRDVAYIIKADVWLPPEFAQEEQVKHRSQFRKRVSRGACYHRPYLGCREFSAHFCEPDETEKPINVTADLGLMLFDIAFIKGKVPSDLRQKFVEFYEHSLENNQPMKHLVTGYTQRIDFPAFLDKGILRISPSLYDEIGETIQP